MNARLSQVALRQGGVFTAQDAVRSGYSRDAIRHRVDSGRWTRVGRGVFAAAGALPAETLPRVLRECWTALLAHPDAVLGFGVAAELNGLDTYRPHPGLDLVRSRAARRTPDVGQVRVTRGWPGIRSLRLALDVADEGAESALESLAHVMQREEGIPRPRTQISLYDMAGLIGRVDDYWPDEATVGESDGMFKYTSRDRCGGRSCARSGWSRPGCRSSG